MTEIVAAHLERVAKQFHEAYERLAPQFGYETRKESAVPWEQVPEPNRKLMEAVCKEVLAAALAACARESRKEAFEEAAKVVDGLQTSAVRNRMAKLIRERAAGESSLAPQGGQHEN